MIFISISTGGGLLMDSFSALKHIFIKGWSVAVFVGIVFITVGCYTGATHPVLIQDSFVKMYPPDAYAEQMEGTVKVMLQIDQTGTVSQVNLLRTSGYPVLDTAALDLARNFRFIPGKNQPMSDNCWMTWSVSYKLGDQSVDYDEWYMTTLNLLNQLGTDSFPATKVLSQYVDLANKVAQSRDLDANHTILKTVSPGIAGNWREYDTYWPLHFVLYLDFLNRVHEGKQRKIALNYLQQTLNREIEQLRVPYAIDPKIPKAVREALLQKLLEIKTRNSPVQAS